MSPERESQVLNTLKANGMSDGNVALALTALDPVITALEQEWEEDVQAMQKFRERAHALEDEKAALEKGEKIQPAADQDYDDPFDGAPYLTIVPNRTPREKVHKNLGLAKGAISHHTAYGSYYEFVMYKFVDGRWVRILTVPRGTKSEDLPWRKDKNLGLE